MKYSYKVSVFARLLAFYNTLEGNAARWMMIPSIAVEIINLSFTTSFLMLLLGSIRGKRSFFMLCWVEEMRYNSFLLESFINLILLRDGYDIGSRRYIFI